MLDIKRFLPKRLYGRSLLIIIVPMLLLQIALTYIFLERHWDRMTRRLSHATAGEAVLIHKLYGLAESDSAERARLERWGKTHMDMNLSFLKGAALPQDTKPAGFLEQFFPLTILAENIKKNAPDTMFFIENPAKDSADIHFALPDGVLHIRLPLSRVYATKTQIFIIWMYSISFVLLAISILFLRNQIRPIERLSDAVRRFGRGLDMPSFRIAGAYEVREAGVAFLEMKKRIERQIAQRTDLLTGVSHDMRTPLTRLKLQVEMLPESEERDLLKEDILEMEAMLKTYLDFARGIQAEQEEDVDIGDLLLRIKENPTWRARVELGEMEDSLTMHARKGAIRRCLENLVSNACAYAERAQISARRREKGVEIVVDDDGPGIRREDWEKAFQPFQRLDGARNPDRPGTGLGLTIARDIARSHGGDVFLGASPQGGLQAKIWLPT